jgi:hypothetical protein
MTSARASALHAHTARVRCTAGCALQQLARVQPRGSLARKTKITHRTLRRTLLLCALPCAEVTT